MNAKRDDSEKKCTNNLHPTYSMFANVLPVSKLANTFVSTGASYM